MTTEEMLEKREEIKLAWGEPWQARGPGGEEAHADITLTATVKDCINIQRALHYPSVPTDECLLLDFIAIHWAVPQIP